MKTIERGATTPKVRTQVVAGAAAAEATGLSRFCGAAAQNETRADRRVNVAAGECSNTASVELENV
jgi:hypothetical protein